MLRPLLLIITALTCAACLPSEHCATIPVGHPASALPLMPYSFDSQGGIFDTHFVPQLEKGPPEERCCFALRNNRELAGCPLQLDCTLFVADAMRVRAPYSDGEHLGGYFCHVAVRDERVVSVWGQYND